MWGQTYCRLMTSGGTGLDPLGVSLTIALLIVSLVLTAVALFVADGKDSVRVRPSVPALVGLVVAILILGGIAFKFDQPNHRMGSVIGLAVGALAIVLAEVLGGKVAPIGVAVSSVTLLHFLPPGLLPSSQYALIIGAAVASLALAGSVGTTAALTITACVAGDYFGAGHKNVPASIDSGVVLGISALAGMILSHILPAKFHSARPLVTGLIVVGGGFALSQRISETHLAMAIGVAALAAVVICYLIPNEERDVFRLIVAGIMTVTVATIGYAFYRNAGISAALITLFAVFLVAGNRTAILASSMVLGLVMMRLLQKADPGYTQSLDIGQHFILLGLFLGATVPILPLLVTPPKDIKASVVSLLWVLTLTLICVFILVMLGHRGVNGFVAGLGLAGVVVALKQEQNLMPMAVGPGMVGILVFLLDKFDAWTDFNRDEKVKFFLIGGATLAVFAVGISLLSRPQKDEVAA